MQRTRHELEPGIWLDARRAVWFAEQKTLAVADLHLGYAWAQRSVGSMLPLCAIEGTVARLSALAHDYGPAEMIIMGDAVHRAIPLDPVRLELVELCAAFSEVARLRLLGGNHDRRGLARLLGECDLSLKIEPEARVGPHCLLHGDIAPPGWNEHSDPDAPFARGRIFMGHEHPAIRMGDGVASVKCPCFLIGPRVVVLPAFSDWAAGSNVRQGKFLSPIAQHAKFTHAVAVIAGKLLPVEL